MLAFGTRSVRMTKLVALDSVLVPGADQQTAAKRVEATLVVFKSARDAELAGSMRERAAEGHSEEGHRGDAQPHLSEATHGSRVRAEGVLAAHKQGSLIAAAEAGHEVGVQSALVEQHVWKAAATLFSHMCSASDQGGDGQQVSLTARRSMQSPARAVWCMRTILVPGTNCAW